MVQRDKISAQFRISRRREERYKEEVADLNRNEVGWAERNSGQDLVAQDLASIPIQELRRADKDRGLVIGGDMVISKHNLYRDILK
jgi:hypothetical protein